MHADEIDPIVHATHLIDSACGWNSPIAWNNFSKCPGAILKMDATPVVHRASSNFGFEAASLIFGFEAWPSAAALRHLVAAAGCCFRQPGLCNRGRQ